MSFISIYSYSAGWIMRNKGAFMTQTIQPRSWTLLNGADKDLKRNEPETEDNMSLMLQVFNSLNELYESLIRLEYVVKRKNMEVNMKREC
jgi:hypothetical protein